jgi:Cu-Zn family superoxide dismutase
MCRNYVLTGLVLGASACTVGEPGGQVATSTLESRSGSTVTGSAAFLDTPSGIRLVIGVEGASPGAHGVHLHAVGDCSAPDAMSAMGHWNPEMHMHGDPGVDGAHHAGDVGNLMVKADGTGLLTFEAADWEVGSGSPMDIMGKAIIVHASPDDLATQMPPGNAGARQACGVIK